MKTLQGINMVAKKELASALQRGSGKAHAATSNSKAKPIVVKESQSNTPPSRRGKKAITGFFDPTVSRQLKQLALDKDKTIQSLLSEALNDLFIKHDRTPIA